MEGGPNRYRSLLSKEFNLAEMWNVIALNSNPVRHSAKYKENTKECYLSATELDILSEQ